MAEAIDREAIEHGWTIRDKRIEPDHIVVVVETWPNHSPERTVHRLQAAAKAARRRYPDDFPTETLWAKGYAVTTDLDLLDDLVAKLLGNQNG
jgi:REP element-mobilizing transposase RayT